MELRLGRLVAPVAADLERMRDVMVAQMEEGSFAVRDMTSHIGRFRGKQLRGTLVLLAGDATSTSTDEHPKVAAIVEMIHLATLVHDDVLDGASVRRRVACVNERWDNQVAVLLGDFLYARAFALSTDLSSRLASQILAEATRRVCVGEIEEAGARYDFELSQERYESIAAAKTGVLYGAACELGARYPGGHEDLGDRMRAFGEKIGLAFQIVDDCLDLVGTQEVVGKSVGNDVEDGKVTLPVLWTFGQADEATQGRIRDVFTEPGLEGKRTEQLREVCDLGPGVEYAMARAKSLSQEAKALLADLPDSQARRSLEELAGFVLERRF